MFNIDLIKKLIYGYSALSIPLMVIIYIYAHQQGAVSQAIKDDVKAKELIITNLNQVTYNQQKIIDLKDYMIEQSESKATDLTIKLTHTERKLLDANKAIATANLSNTKLSPDFLRIIQRASTENPIMFDPSANATTNITTSEELSRSYLYWNVGLIAHDQDCVNVANARLDWYNELRDQYNAEILDNR